MERRPIPGIFGPVRTHPNLSRLSSVPRPRRLDVLYSVATTPAVAPAKRPPLRHRPPIAPELLPKLHQRGELLPARRRPKVGLLSHWRDEAGWRQRDTRVAELPHRIPPGPVDRTEAEPGIAHRSRSPGPAMLLHR